MRFTRSKTVEPSFGFDEGVCEGKLSCFPSTKPSATGSGDEASVAIGPFTIPLDDTRYPVVKGGVSDVRGTERLRLLVMVRQSLSDSFSSPSRNEETETRQLLCESPRPARPDKFFDVVFMQFYTVKFRGHLNLLHAGPPRLSLRRHRPKP